MAETSPQCCKWEWGGDGEHLSERGAHRQRGRIRQHLVQPDCPRVDGLRLVETAKHLLSTWLEVKELDSQLHNRILGQLEKVILSKSWSKARIKLKCGGC